MIRKFYYILNILILTMTIIPLSEATAQNFDLEGHRGARGLLPENSIPAFLKALDLGVTTIEMDVVISADKKVVVSHEHYFSSTLCLDPYGNAIKKENEKDHNIYLLDYDEISKFDCGSSPHPDFPDQKNVTTVKPLLIEVIRVIEKHIKGETGYLVQYNIEIKSSEKGDNIYHPEIPEFSSLVNGIINKYLDPDRIIIQSFDFRVLRYWHEHYPDVKLAALVDNIKSIELNLEELGFVPDIYSPYYKLLYEKEIKTLHAKNMKVIPWTVNERKDMQKLVEAGADGLITDYPDRAKELGLGVEIPYMTQPEKK